MAKQVKNRKPVSGKTKGLICLVLLCALTVFVSVLGIAGMKLDSEGVNVLLPWVPVNSANWPASLALNRALGGGTYVEYTAKLDEGASLDDVVKVMNARLEGIGETDKAITAQGADTVRMELRGMAEDRLANARGLAVMGGKFEFRNTDGQAVLTDKDTEKAVLTVNSQQTAYIVNVTLTDEAAKKMAESGTSYLTAYLDGDQVTTASVKDNILTMSFLTSNFNAASNVAYFLNTGSLGATLTRKDMGTTDAAAGSVRMVVLLVAAVLLLGACAYLVFTGKLTGISGIWTVWCAVLLGLFFTATLVVPSVYALNVGCLIAMLLGVLLAVYTAVTRKDAISKNIQEGAAPKQATKLGFRACAKQVWIAHGAVLAVALILMIFSFSKPIGYTLAAFVCGSAFTAWLMRVFQACFTTMTKDAALFGKTK